MRTKRAFDVKQKAFFIIFKWFLVAKISLRPESAPLKMIYNSLFGSHIHYGVQLWGQTNTENQKQIEILRNRAVQKIAFKKHFDQTDPLYKESNILKFRDIMHHQNCLCMDQTEHNEKLAINFPTVKHCGDNYSYDTRSAAKKLLDIPLLNTETYGTRLSKCNRIIDWNNF